MTYKMITAAEPDWFFVQIEAHPIEGRNRPLIMRVAAWALLETGHVVGLVGAQRMPTNRVDPSSSKKEPDPVGLAPPTSHANGIFKHLRDFTPAELAELAKLTPRAVQGFTA